MSAASAREELSPEEQLKAVVSNIKADDEILDINKYTNLLIRYCLSVPREQVIAKMPQILLEYVIPITHLLTPEQRESVTTEIKTVLSRTMTKGGARKTRRRYRKRRMTRRR